MNDGTPERAGMRAAAGFTVLAAVFAYTLMWIPQGLDFTDEGHHLTNALMFGERATDYPFGMQWLTYAISSLWLRLVLPSLGLVGARLGWALTIALTALGAWRVLSAYFHAWPSALAAIGTAGALLYHGNMVINQNNIAFLLLLMGAAGVLAADRAARGGVARRLWAGVGGAFLGLATLARFPLCLALALPLVPPAVRWACLRRTSRAEWTAAPVAIAAAAAVVAMGLAWLAWIGKFAAFVVSVAGSGLDEDYGAARLLALYGRDALRMAGLLGVLALKIVPAAVVLHLVLRRLRRAHWGPPLLGAALAAWVAWVVRHHGVDAFQNEYFLVLPTVAVAAGLALLGLALARRDAADLAVLLAVALAAAGLIVPGTNNGLMNLVHGLWLLLPATALALPRLVPAPAAAAYGAVVLIVLAAVGSGLRSVNPYRDVRRRFTMAGDFIARPLDGIMTTPGRAESVRALAAAMAERVKPGARLLAYNDIPMVHLLTRTVPALDVPWPEVLTLSELKARLDRLARDPDLPAAAVRALTDTGDRNWGTRQRVAEPDPDTRRKAETIDAALERMGYRETWRSRDFVILERVPAGAAVAPAGT